MKIYFFDIGVLHRGKIRRVLDSAAKFLNQPKNIEFSVTFVGAEEIRQLNSRTRNLDKATDVLSFPTLMGLEKGIVEAEKFQADINPKTKNIMLGDIIICKEIAKNQAEEYGHSLVRELCFLALHGFLHLLGYDHMTDSDQAEMSALQEKILEKCNILRK